MKTFWISTKQMTVMILVRDEIIIDASPIIRKFIGQSVTNLLFWANKQGGIKVVEL